MRCGSNLRDLLEQFDIFVTLTELEVADEGAERVSTENAKFLFIDFLEHRTLVEFWSALQVSQQLFLGRVEDFNLQHGTGLATIQQILQTAPGSLQLLEGGMVHHFIELE